MTDLRPAAPRLRCLVPAAIAALVCLIAPGESRAAPAPFALGAPASGTYLNVVRPTFTWSTTTSADGMQGYVLIIDDEVAGVVDADDCSATCSLTPADALAEGSHFWSVIAVDGADEETESSERALSIDVTPSGPPVDLQASGTRLSWSSAGSDAISYDVLRNGVLVAQSDVRSYNSVDRALDSDFAVFAVDRAGNRSVPATLSVRASATGALTVSPSIAWVGQPVTVSAAFPPWMDLTGGSFDWQIGRPFGVRPIGGGSLGLTEVRALTTFAPTLTTSFSVSETGTREVRLTPTLPARGSTTTDVSVTVRATTPVASLRIADGAKFTSKRRVTLSLEWPADATGMVLSSTKPRAAAQHGALATRPSWNLTGSGRDGRARTVYASFQRYGGAPIVVSDSIVLDLERPTLTSASLRGRRLKLVGRDAVSGLATVQTAIDKARPARAIRYKPTLSNIKAARWVRVGDRAGNYSGWARVRQSKTR